MGYLMFLNPLSPTALHQMPSFNSHMQFDPFPVLLYISIYREIHSLSLSECMCRADGLEITTSGKGYTSSSFTLVAGFSTTRWSA